MFSFFNAKPNSNNSQTGSSDSETFADKSSNDHPNDSSSLTSRFLNIYNSIVTPDPQDSHHSSSTPPTNNPEAAHKIFLSTLTAPPEKPRNASISSFPSLPRRGSDFYNPNSRRRSSAANWDTISINSNTTSTYEPIVRTARNNSLANGVSHHNGNRDLVLNKAYLDPGYIKARKDSFDMNTNGQYGSLRRESTRSSFLGPTNLNTLTRGTTMTIHEFGEDQQRRVYENWGVKLREHRNEFSALLEETAIASLFPEKFIAAKLSDDAELPSLKSLKEKNQPNVSSTISDTLIRTLMGHLSVVGPEENLVVKIFITAEEDSEWERNTLRVDVIPYLRTLCRHLDLEFQVIDLGIQYAPDLLPSGFSTKILRECMNSSVVPCHVAIVGNKYGTPKLPTLIAQDEFDAIIQHLIDNTPASEEHLMNQDLHNFLKYYILNMNSTPHQYELRCETSQDGTSNMDERAFERMMLLFQRASANISMRSEEKKKYFNSRLHEELEFTIERMTSGQKNEHLFVFRRDFQSLDLVGEYASLYMDIKTTNDGKIIRNTEMESQRTALVLSINSKVSPDDVRTFYVPWRSKLNQSSGLINIGFNPMKDSVHEEYMRDFCDDFCWNIGQSILLGFAKFQFEIKSKILSGVSKKFCDITKELYQEVVRHQQLILETGGPEFVPVGGLMDKIDGYFSSSAGVPIFRYPLVVIGPEGSGKTFLLSAASRCAFHYLPHGVIISRMCGHTASSLNLRSLLLSIVRQLAYVFGSFETLPVPGDWNDVVNLFKKSLSLATERTPIVLILDSLDRSVLEDGDSGIEWLLGGPTKSEIMPNVFIVISLSSSSNAVSVLESNSLYSSFQYIYIPPLESPTINEMIARWSELDFIKLISNQQIKLIEYCNDNPWPLYVKVAWDIVQDWKSNESIDSLELKDTVEELVNMKFQKAELKFGEHFVRRALGYITATRKGLTVTELDDILSCDEDVLIPTYRNVSPSIRRVPHHRWLLLYEYLKMYLTMKKINGAELYYWKHDCFSRVASARYLNTPSVERLLHERLVDYFSSKWSSTPKPFVDPDRVQKTDLRYVSDQPLFFKDHYTPNRRRAENLIYHQIKSLQKHEVVRSLTSFDVLVAAARLQMIQETIFLYDLASKEFPDIAPSLAPFREFLAKFSFYLEQHPDELYQHAANQPVDSDIAKLARSILNGENLNKKGTLDGIGGTKIIPKRWLNWLNRPTVEIEPIDFCGTIGGATISCIAFHDNFVAVLGTDALLRVFDWTRGGLKVDSAVVDENCVICEPTTTAISFSHSGEHVAVACNGFVRVFSVDGLNLEWLLMTNDGEAVAEDVKISWPVNSDGQTLAVSRRFAVQGIAVNEIDVWKLWREDSHRVASVVFNHLANNHAISAHSSVVFCLEDEGQTKSWIDCVTFSISEGTIPNAIPDRVLHQFAVSSNPVSSTWALSPHSKSSIIKVEAEGIFVVVKQTDEGVARILGCLPAEVGIVSLDQTLQTSKSGSDLIKRAINDDGSVIAIANGTEISLWMCPAGIDMASPNDLNNVQFFINSKVLYLRESLDWLLLTPDGGHIFGASSSDPDARVICWDLSNITASSDYVFQMDYVSMFAFADVLNEDDEKYPNDGIVVVADPHGKLLVLNEVDDQGKYSQLQTFEAETATSIANINGLQSTIIESAIMGVDLKRIDEKLIMMYVIDTGVVGLRRLDSKLDIPDITWELPIKHLTACVFLKANGKDLQFATGHKSGEVIIWNSVCNETDDSLRYSIPVSTHVFTHGASWVLSVTISVCGQYLSSIATNGSILIVPFAKYLQHNTEDYSDCYYLHHVQASCLSFSAYAPNSPIPYLATGSGDGSICIWSLKENNVMVLPGHSKDSFGAQNNLKTVLTVKWIPGTSILSSIGEDLTLKFWNVVDGQLIHEFSLEWINSSVIVANFNGDCSKIALFDSEGKVYMIKVEGIEEIIELTKNTDISLKRSSSLSARPEYRPGTRQRRSQTSKALPYTDHHRSLLNLIHVQNRKLKLWPNESTLANKQSPFYQTVESIQSIVTSVVTPQKPLPAGCYTVEWDIEVDEDNVPTEDMVFLVVCIGKQQQARVCGFRRFFTKEEQNATIVGNGITRVFLGYLQVLWPSTMHISFAHLDKGGWQKQYILHQVHINPTDPSLWRPEYAYDDSNTSNMQTIPF
ncbi:hypothetical protein HK098_002491 [Nowakowskiella sp. JEL0407]|nr:hypothetical protein HK098_002491 [Nowakowskiella sp. JEL0407]